MEIGIRNWDIRANGIENRAKRGFYIRDLGKIATDNLYHLKQMALTRLGILERQ